MFISDKQHSMTENNSVIEIHFGVPSSLEKEDFINSESIKYGCSVERMLVDDFTRIFNTIWMKPGGPNIFKIFFKLYFGSKMKDEITCPEVTFGTYKNKENLYPKVIIHGEYLENVRTKEYMLITDEMIEWTGKELDLDYDFEYVEFLRIKK